MSIAPMPTRQIFASYPDELKRVSGWQSEVVTTCNVSVDGKCSSIDLTMPPGMPESLRGFAKASLMLDIVGPSQTFREALKNVARSAGAIARRPGSDVPL